MKQAIIGFLLIMILVLSGVSIYTIHNQTIRKNELDANMAAAMEQSMAVLAMDVAYREEADVSEERIIEFIQHFLSKTTSDSEFVIEILSVDTKEGLLDVRVTEEFSQFIPVKGHVECRKTMVLEEYENEREQFYPVTFWVGEQIVKQIHVYGGNTLLHLQPEDPVKEQAKFTGWRLDGSSHIYREEIGQLRVLQELKFTAVFEEVQVGGEHEKGGTKTVE